MKYLAFLNSKWLIQVRFRAAEGTYFCSRGFSEPLNWGCIPSSVPSIPKTAIQAKATRVMTKSNPPKCEILKIHPQTYLDLLPFGCLEKTEKAKPSPTGQWAAYGPVPSRGSPMGESLKGTPFCREAQKKRTQHPPTTVFYLRPFLGQIPSCPPGSSWVLDMP